MRNRHAKKSTNPSPAIRMAVLERDGYRCVRCGKLITSGSIHHRHMRSHPYPGLNSLSNLITLCGSGTTGCHGWVHANPAEAYDEGYLIHGYQEDSEAVPVCYHGALRSGFAYLTDDGNVIY